MGWHHVRVGQRTTRDHAGSEYGSLAALQKHFAAGDRLLRAQRMVIDKLSVALRVVDAPYDVAHLIANLEDDLGCRIIPSHGCAVMNRQIDTIPE